MIWSISDSVRTIAPFIKPYWKRGLFLCICLTFIAALRLPGPFLTRYLIDVVIPQRSHNTLTLIGVSLALIYVLHCMFHLSKGLLLVRFKERVLYDLQTHLWRHILSLPLPFFQKHQSGYIVSRLTSEARNVEHMLTDTAFGLLVDLATFVFGLVALLSFDVRLTLISLSVLPVYILSQAWFGSRIKQRTKDLQESAAQQGGNIQEKISGVVVIKAFNQEKREVHQHARFLHMVIKGKVKITMMLYLFTGTSALFGSVAPLCALWYGSSQVMAGNLSLGTIIAFMSILGYLFGPTNRVIELNMQIKQASASIERIKELLIIPPEDDPAEAEGDIEIKQGDIVYRNVTFSYEFAPILTDVSMRAKPRQILAIVGSSGSGKSTLLNLLPRFYSPQSGEVLIDGHDIREFSLKSLRRQIAVVDQDTILFDGSIHYNIAYGRRSATRADVIAAAKLANAHDFIMRLSSGYDTQVAERGSNLSGGEKQRLAIARAILLESKVLLLDEATSSLDSESEALIHDSLAKIRTRMTTIVVAHKLSTVLQADTIVVIDHGRVVAEGGHDYLASHSPRYRALFEAQLGTIHHNAA
ncbi:MAG: ABC transporter ATP-binding protein [Acidobacteriota bacterium]